MQKKCLGGRKKPDLLARKEVQIYTILLYPYSLAIKKIGIIASLIVIPEV